MKNLKKFSKKIKLVYVSSAISLCLVMTTIFPMFSPTFASGNGYYLVVLNGKELGAVSGKRIVEKAVNDARLRLNKKSDSIVYFEPDLDIYKQDKLFGKKQTKEQLEEKIYDVLLETADLDKKQAYVVNIDGLNVTLGHKEDVIKLLESAKSKFDTENKFNVDLVESTSGTFSSITYNITKSDTEGNGVNQVMSALPTFMDDVETTESTSLAKGDDNTDGIVNLYFEDNIDIVESHVDSDEIMDLDQAVELVTKENAENKIYHVKAGDVLSTIAADYNLKMAELLAMNQGLSENSLINIGDEIIVTVPEPELNVIVQEEKTYQENFNAQVEYVEDASVFKGEDVVLNEGSQGLRDVKAKITYRNGTETGREILEENVIIEPVAKVVKIGTKIPPTFVKPLSGGRVSSGFGPRWGTMHKGVDWACPTGTAIRASCGGTVVSAGWHGGYGNSILIRHSNGNQTRYAHLSKILVSAGQKVNQSDKIALSGNTGNSTGPHLHFETIVNGRHVNPLGQLQ